MATIKQKIDWARKSNTNEDLKIFLLEVFQISDDLILKSIKEDLRKTLFLCFKNNLDKDYPLAEKISLTLPHLLANSGTGIIKPDIIVPNDIWEKIKKQLSGFKEVTLNKNFQFNLAKGDANFSISFSLLIPSVNIGATLDVTLTDDGMKELIDWLKSEELSAEYLPYNKKYLIKYPH